MHQRFVCNTFYNMNYHKSLCTFIGKVWLLTLRKEAPKAALERKLTQMDTCNIICHTVTYVKMSSDNTTSN